MVFFHPNFISALGTLLIGFPRTNFKYLTIPDLIGAINEYIESTNNNPKPFVWTATVEAILSKVKRANEVLDTLH